MADTPERIQKWIARAGLASRRGAEALIAEGRVTIDGKVATLGDVGDPALQTILVDGRRLQPPPPGKATVLMLNKPKGVVCTHQDPNHPQERTIYALLPRAWQKRRWVCAGRLDKDSTGLVILTDDGDLAQQIMHPSGEVLKRYRVQLHRSLQGEDLPALLHGREVEGDWLQFQKVIPAPGGPDSGKRCEVHLSQGRKREIRRLFESLGYFVNKLHRFQIGGLVLKGLPPGGHRRLKPREVDILFR
ncbi:MAG: pseudouridine synthase [Opitutales bacterium]